MPPRIGPKRPIHVYLARWRNHFDLTLDQVGGRFDPPVAKGTISRWEAHSKITDEPGGLTVGVAAAYAEALGIHVRQLFNIPPPKERRGQPDIEDITPTLTPEQRAELRGYLDGLKGRKAS